MKPEDIISTVAEALSRSEGAVLPQGAFAGNLGGRFVTGLRAAGREGATFYLAVLEPDAFKGGPGQPQAAVAAAEAVLLARQSDMCTVEEWVTLARAVAAATGCKTADLLTERDLEQAAEYKVPWDQTVDGALPDAEA